MTIQTARSIEIIPPRKGLPSSFDDMSVGEFFELVQWWAALPSADRQAVLAARHETRH